MDKVLFDELIESVQLMKKHVRGEAVHPYTFKVNPASVRAIRSKIGLSQRKFAELIDVKLGTLRNWEQGVRHPTGPARVLLRVLWNDPATMLRAIATSDVRMDSGSTKKRGANAATRQPAAPLARKSPRGKLTYATAARAPRTPTEVSRPRKRPARR